MGNTHNNSDMNLPPPEKNNIQYHEWIDDIYKEIRYVYLKPNEHHINVLKLLDTFLEKFRQYIQRKHGDSTRVHDYHLVKETNRLMFLVRDLFSERNDQHYLMKTSEILGGCTFLWLRYHSLADEQYNETHIEKILNCYAIYLQSTTDESFMLKIITHTLYVCKKLPRIFYKILEMHLKRRVQRKERRNVEAKEDQLYILYIIAFKLWDRLQPDGENKINIAQYANSYMKPMNSLLSNPRYVPNLPKITSEDVKCGRATKILINNLLPSKLLKLAEAVVKEDWLKGSDINAPITVDLSIDDDVNRSEQAVENDRTLISVNTEIKDLSLDEKQSNLSKKLWWLKVLQNRARKNMNTSGTENYRVVEVIDLDDEDVHNCDSTSKTNVEMEVQNQSKTTQNKEVDNAKKVDQKQISNEENFQTKKQEPEKNKEANSVENICERSGTTQEKDDNCTAIMVEKHVLEDSQVRHEVNSCSKFTGTQIIQVESMETDSIVEETNKISGSKELQLEKQQSKQPRMVKIDRRKSESDGSEGVLCINTEDKNNDGKKNLKSRTPLKSVDENDLVHISDRPIDSMHEKSIHIIDAAVNNSMESLQTNGSPDDERAINNTTSISSIVEESENYDTIDPKIDDIHIEKISPVVNVKASKHKKNTSDGSVLFSKGTGRKLSPLRKVEEYKDIFKENSPQKDRVVFSASTANIKIRIASPNLTCIHTTPDMDHDEIKSPPVESFSKSDTDEFKKIFNNKNHLNTHRHEEKVATENNKQTEDKSEHTVENLISKKTNQVTKRSILTKTDGNIRKGNLSTSNVKRKAVSFATVMQDKAPLFLNRSAHLDSIIIERKTYNSPLTIQNEPQNWKSSINNSPPLSSQQNRTSQEQNQEIELISTSDVKSLGSSSPPPMKESGMTQNMFQFENDTQLSVFNDDAVGNNTEVLPNKSCASDNNLVSATDLSISSNTLKVKTDLMSSESELNNAEEDSINMIWQLITEHCDTKPDEKKLQNSLPLKKRRKLSRDANSFVEVNCKESSDKKAFDHYDKQIAYPAERCMSIMQFLDISQCQTTFFVNNSSDKKAFDYYDKQIAYPPERCMSILQFLDS